MAFELRTSPRDLALSGGLILIFLAYVGWVAWDVQSKRQSLAARAESIVDDTYEGLNRDDFEWLIELESGKRNYLFGADWGVIRFYSRKKGDVNMESFMGLERFHEYRDGNWQETDFARIDVPEHIYTGYRYFEANGYGVSNDAYQRYNR